MHDRARPSLSFAPWLALAAALGCGDSTADPVDDGSSGDPTAGSTDGLTTASTSTQTDPTVATATSLDSSGDDPTTASMAAEIEVSIEARPIPSGGSYELLDPVDVGAMGEVITVTVENTGGTELSVASVGFDAGAAHFALDDTGLDPVVAAGATTSFTVAFVPGNGGRKQGQLTIDSDDPDEGTYSITLDARTTPNTYRAVEPATAPSARFNTGLAATDDGRVLLFGGRGADGLRTADTWLFDVEAGEWTELRPATAPSPRDTHAMAHVGGGMIVLFGGNETNGPDETPLGDTWLFDLATEEWTELLPAASPPVRFQHDLVAVGDGLALLQGGRVDFGVELADTWHFDLATEAWTELAPPTDPGVRSAFALAFDGVDTVAMVGGTVASSALTDETWRYGVSNNEWTLGAAADLGPRFSHDAVWLEGGLVVFSGKDDIFGEPVPGTWAYDAMADTWTDLAPRPEPAPRFAHAAVSVPGDKAILFGGLLLNGGPASAVAETWEYVGP